MTAADRKPARPTRLRQQRGVAALLVVMLLFAVVSLAAAYANRNLIFEQKTSANLARSTAAFEAADGGIEWAVGQLNGGLIDASCDPLPPGSAGTSFQQRYVDIERAVGSTQGRALAKVRAASSLGAGLWPACVFNGNAWSCSCPDAAAALPSVAIAAGPAPAFRIWVGTGQPPTQNSPWALPFLPDLPGLLTITSQGCTRLPTAGEAEPHCLSFDAQGQAGEGLMLVRQFAVLRSGLTAPPSMPVMARLNFTPDPDAAASVVVRNDANPELGGVTVNTGAALSAARISAASLPGVTQSASLVGNDPLLQALAQTATSASTANAPTLTAGERMFVSVFGVRRDLYREQPGLRLCSSSCDATEINRLLVEQPFRIIWVDGNLSLASSVGTPPTGGAAAVPVLLIVNGASLTLGAGVNVYGFIYLTGGNSAVSTIELPDAPTRITGAIVAEGGLRTHYAGTGPVGAELSITYDRPALDALRVSYGSWVKLTGGWKDYR